MQPLLAGFGNITQSATGDMSVGGDLIANAGTGAITMDNGAVSTATGNISYIANSNVSLGSLNGANITVTATNGSIIDNGEGDVDLIATNLQLVAGAAVGEVEGSGNGLLETTVTNVAASAGAGGVYLSETDNLIIGSVAAIPVDTVANTGAEGLVAGSVLTGVVAATDVIITAGNGLTVDSVVTATGDDLLLDAQNGNLAINALVTVVMMQA